MREEDLSVNELQHKKKGRLLLLGKKLDNAVQEYILKLRECGYPINTHLVIAVARGIMQAMNQTRLAECNGSAVLATFWAKSLCERMNFAKRRASTQKCLIQLVSMTYISPELIFNWDHTGINLVSKALRTLDKKGKK